jgi:hypothetical protein
LPALGSVALSLDTGEDHLGGSIFSGRCDRGRLRAIHGRGFGAQLDPIISSLCRCRGLEQHHAMASVSAGSLGNKGPSAFGSLPWVEGEFSDDAFATATRSVPEHRTVPDVQPARAPADLPRPSGHESTS